jgi:CheY-like chemotaxis protein
MLYRVALQGFEGSERRSLASLLRETGRREPGYQLVRLSADADVIIADSDSAQVVGNVVTESRISTTLFIGEHRPIEAAWHVSRPTEPAQVLRGLDGLVALLDQDLGGRAFQGDENSHALAKAAARQAARRARLASSAKANVGSIRADVLVLEHGDSHRDHLCALLENFGFCAYPARNVTQAMWLLEDRMFRAAFLDIPLDGGDGGAGIELCRRVKTGARFRPDAGSALFLIRDGVQSADRVLAVLAGCDALLVKPLSRGDVAGALEAAGVVMPADARRG